jgi:hypothetical protein
MARRPAFLRRWFIRRAVEALENGAVGFTAWTMADVVGHSKEDGPLPMTMGRYPGKASFEAMRACIEAVKLPDLKPQSEGTAKDALRRAKVPRDVIQALGGCAGHVKAQDLREAGRGLNGHGNQAMLPIDWCRSNSCSANISPVNFDEQWRTLCV